MYLRERNKRSVDNTVVVYSYPACCWIVVADSIWFDLIRFDLIWFDLIWFSVVMIVLLCCWNIYIYIYIYIITTTTRYENKKKWIEHRVYLSYKYCIYVRYSGERDCFTLIICICIVFFVSCRKEGETCWRKGLWYSRRYDTLLTQNDSLQASAIVYQFEVRSKSTHTPTHNIQRVDR